jgi:hypothetical protein
VDWFRPPVVDHAHARLPSFYQAYDSKMKFCWPVVALFHSIKRTRALAFVSPTASGRRHHRLQQRVAKRHQLQLCASIHLEQEQLSTFQVFETSVLNRIKESRQAHDGDSHSSPLVRQRDANSVVTMSFIQDMLHLSDYERMKQLASIMNENGGY